MTMRWPSRRRKADVGDAGAWAVLAGGARTLRRRDRRRSSLSPADRSADRRPGGRAGRPCRRVPGESVLACRPAVPRAAPTPGVSRAAGAALRRREDGGTLGLPPPRSTVLLLGA